MARLLTGDLERASLGQRHRIDTGLRRRSSSSTRKYSTAPPTNVPPVSLPELTATTSGVGIPVGERILTDALDSFAPRMVAPGPGRSLVHLREVEIGTGRPDAILIVLSSAGLKARLRADLRLPSLAHARVLESIRTGIPSGYCPSHVNQLTNSLRDWGWLTKHQRVRSVASLIHRSLTVEAKMSDWRRGIGQLAKARWASHAAALLMPRDRQHRVSRKTLRHNRIGLLVAHQEVIRWQIEAPSLELSWMADLWLTELAIRAVETGQA